MCQRNCILGGESKIYLNVFITNLSWVGLGWFGLILGLMMFFGGQSESLMQTGLPFCIAIEICTPRTATVAVWRMKQNTCVLKKSGFT